jgi:hypothetical protein
MVDKKAAAGIAILTGVGIAALALTRKAEAPPTEEGAPEGEVTIEVTPLGMPEGYSFEDVEGAWGVGSTIKVNGKCTAGFPVPSMLLELYDKGVKRKETTIAAVTLGTPYTLTDTMGAADVGDHTVYGRMVLTNPLGSYEFTTATQSFSIGAAPPGEVTLEVTLTPA